jgi:hypothetical protein
VQIDQTPHFRLQVQCLKQLAECSPPVGEGARLPPVGEQPASWSSVGEGESRVNVISVLQPLPSSIRRPPSSGLVAASDCPRGVAMSTPLSAPLSSAPAAARSCLPLPAAPSASTSSAFIRASLPSGISKLHEVMHVIALAAAQFPSPTSKSSRMQPSPSTFFTSFSISSRSSVSSSSLYLSSWSGVRFARELSAHFTSQFNCFTSKKVQILTR